MLLRLNRLLRADVDNADLLHQIHDLQSNTTKMWPLVPRPGEDPRSVLRQLTVTDPLEDVLGTSHRPPRRTKHDGQRSLRRLSVV